MPSHPVRSDDCSSIDRDPSMGKVPPKWWTLLLVASALFLALAWRLPSLVVSDADEGTYIYAGRLLTEGRFPYRDFLFAHPPGMILLTASAWLVSGGSLLGVRLFFLGLALLGLVPAVLLVQRFTRSWIAGLAAGEAVVVGLLFMANMGRTARLEPVMLVFLMWGFLAWVNAPRSIVIQALAGGLFAVATIVKLTSVVPIGLFLIGQLLWNRHEPRRWIAAILGACALGIPALLICLGEPAFREWVLDAQVQRPRDTMDWRLTALAHASVRCPLLPLGLIAAGYELVRGRNPHVRSLALTALVTTFCLAFVFRSVATYYFALPVPFATVVLATRVHAMVTTRAPHFAERGWTAIAFALPFAALLFCEVYHRRAAEHVSEPQAIVPLLQGRQGAVWTMVPDFALFTERPLVDWYYVVDSYLPRKIGVLSDEAVQRSLAQTDTAVLYPSEFDQWPGAKRILERDFTLAHDGPAWHVWLRRVPAPGSALQAH